MNRAKLFVGMVVVLVLLFAPGCTNPFTPGNPLSTATEKRVTARVTLDNGVRYERGVLGPGALYELWVPPNWELTGKSLVLYVHGYVPAAQPVALPSDIGPFRNVLLAQGFAVAYSSFSENGWAVKDGTIRTRQLLGYFKGAYGEPGKTFLVGASEGGLISLMLTEQNPGLFDGTLSICAPVGGARMEIEYLLHVRVLFDYFFRAQLSGLALSDPHPAAAQLHKALGDGPLDATWVASGLPPTTVDGKAFAAYVAPVLLSLLGGSPDAALALATMRADHTPLFGWPATMLEPPYLFLPELAATIAGALWFNVYGTADLLARTHGRAMVDNSGTVYASPLMLPEQIEALNQGVHRLASRPDAANYLRNWYQPTGSLRIPMVTLHTTRDPIVPVQHEYAFRDLVGADRGQLLAQFIVAGFGHCELLAYTGTPPEYFAADPGFAVRLQGAFDYLVLWSATGVKPPVPTGLLEPFP